MSTGHVTMQPQLSKARIDELLGDIVPTPVQAAKWRIVGGILLGRIHGTPTGFPLIDFPESQFADAVTAVCEMPDLALRCQRGTQHTIAYSGVTETVPVWNVYRDLDTLPDHVDVGVPQHNALIHSVITDWTDPRFSGDPLLREVYTRYIADRMTNHHGWFTVTPDYDINDDVKKICAAGFKANVDRDETGCPCCWSDIIVVKYRDDAVVPSFCCC